MKNHFNKTCFIFTMAFFLIGISINGLFAQQPYAPKSSNSNTSITNKVSKENGASSLRNDPEPRFIDGNITWARDLAEPSVYPGYGSGADNNFIVAHRYETNDLTPFDGKSISKVSFIPTYFGGNYEFTAKIWIGGSALNAGTLVAEATFSDLEAYVWNEVAIAPSVQIDADQELWIGIECVADEGYPMGFDLGPQVPGKGNLAYFNGQWEETHSEDPNHILNHLNFCIRGYVQDEAVGSATCPATPSNVFITPDPDFELSTSLVWNNPFSSINGTTLTDLTSIKILRNGTEIHSINNPTPGGSGNFTDNTVSEMGWYDYSIYAVNSNGNGLSVTKTVFVGPIVIMNTYGTQTVTLDEGVLYDDGSKFNWYDVNCTGILTIYPATPDKGIRIYGTYQIETDWDVLTVYAGTDVSGEVLGEFSNSAGGTIPEITSGSGPMTFQFTSDASVVKEGFEIFFDAVSINNDCTPPISLSVLGTTNNSATLSWTPGSGTPESYTVAYKMVSATEFTEIENIESYPCIITELTANTEYEWKVRTSCANISDPSSWSVVSSFTTTCEATNTPIAENFDTYNGGDVPDCWQQFAVMNADWQNRFYPCVDDYADFAHSGTRYIKFWTNAAAEENTIAMLPLVENLKNVEIKFFACYNANDPFFEIGVMEGNNFIAIQEISLTESYQEFTVNMSNYNGNSHRIAFRCSYSGVSNVFLDDINITSSGAPAQYTITATAGANGTITPNGQITVNEGENQTFAIEANEGFQIEDVLVDGASVGIVETYTFENVTANHSISALFEIKPAVQEMNQQFSIFPNPANGSVTIEGAELERISVYNIAGQLIETIAVNEQTSTTIATSHYNSGMYILQLVSKDGSVSSQRFVIQH
ncbi:MAG: T9SS type A sorting domain-containing protein [Bacteroidales bacterium]|nr:T9SS type A sorting domain-containing protein [Bacteroidales bacterium]